MSEVRVRFAPSPTGHLHVGGARTALFNWLISRGKGSSFILRIEDTDTDRSTEKMVDGILAALRWLGFCLNNSPYRQSKHLDRYRKVARKLLKNGDAYPCFCTLEDLKVRKTKSELSGRPWMYDGTCRQMTRVEQETKIQAGYPYALRFRVPKDGMTCFTDQVQGVIKVSNSSLDDFVLLRSDGHPTYHLCVVVDDQNMQITNVIRGVDHISNTFKQILLYEVLGAEMPVFAHLPLILGPDRTRLSKRHGATSILTFRDNGILPEAMINYLALLGWSHPDKKEIFGVDEAIREFSFENISKSNAEFDPEKLSWINSKHLRALPMERFALLAEEELKISGLWSSDYNGSLRNWFENVLRVAQPRMRTLKDFSSSNRYFFTEEYELDPKAINIFWKHPLLDTLLMELAEKFICVNPFNSSETEKCLRCFSDEKGVKSGLMINSSRVALTGQAVAPSLFKVIELLGRGRVTARLMQAAKILSQQKSSFKDGVL